MSHLSICTDGSFTILPASYDHSYQRALLLRTSLKCTISKSSNTVFLPRCSYITRTDILPKISHLAYHERFTMLNINNLFLIRIERSYQISYWFWAQEVGEKGSDNMFHSNQGSRCKISPFVRDDYNKVKYEEQMFQNQDNLRLPTKRNSLNVNVFRHEALEIILSPPLVPVVKDLSVLSALVWPLKQGLQTFIFLCSVKQFLPLPHTSFRILQHFLPGTREAFLDSDTNTSKYKRKSFLHSHYL